MKEIVTGVNALVTGELLRANQDNPPFHSNHEALGVIMEEVMETRAESKCIDSSIEDFMYAVFTDVDADNMRDIVTEIRKHAVMCAGEAIQVAAMCDKFFMSKEGKDE